MSRPGRGFTLIEMLLVVSIIVLLIALLQPMLGRVRAHAQAAQCLTQLHAMSAGLVDYSYQYNGKLFPITHGYGEYWHSRLLPYFGGDPKILLCPAATKPSGGRGSFNEAWGPGGGFFGGLSGSYGMNLWLLPDGVFANDPRMEQIGYWRTSKQNDASSIPAFADSPWVGAWPDDQDIFPTDLTYGWQAHEKGYFMGRFCGDRHMMAVNVGFVDGHAERIPLRELWQLRWHKTFEPGEPK